MRLLIFLMGIYLVSIPSLLSSQTWQLFQPYEFSYVFSPQPISYTTAVDIDGNAFVSGFKSNDVEFQSLIFGDTRIQKIAPDGSLVWETEINGKSRLPFITTINNGSVALAGSFLHNISIEGMSLTGPEFEDKPVVVKFSPAGDFEWMFDLSEIVPQLEKCRAITSGEDNSIWVAGDNFVDSFLIHLSSSGDVLEIVQQSNVNEISSIDMDVEGNLYVAGACAQENAVFKEEPAQVDFSYNSYIAKYDASGVFVWVKFQEETDCTGPIIKVENPDFIYVAAHLSGPRQFGEFTVEGPQSAFAPDFYLACLDSQGDYRWVRDAPGNGRIELGNRACLDVDSENNVFLSGRIQGVTYWENNITTHSQGSNDAIIIRMSSEGIVTLAKTAGGGFEERGDAVSVSPSGAIWLAGVSTGNVTFDSIQHTATTGVTYAYAAKLATPESIESEEEEVSAIASIGSVDFILYPNPANEVLFIDGWDGDGLVKISSLDGKVVNHPISLYSQQVDVSDLAAGFYLISFYKNGLKFYQTKFLVEH